jgi:beta-galactosidase
MAASAVHFRPEDNYTNSNSRAKHTYQFKRCDNSIVNLDAATRGLGNNSCGPDVMEKYELKAANTAFRFFIIPLKADTKAAEAARIDMPVCQMVSVERLTSGKLKMSTTTKNATIWYSINGGEYQKYSTYVTCNDACTVTAYCTANGLMASPVMSYDFDVYVNKSTWTVKSVDSYQGGNEAKLAFDNNNSTFWHTAWGANEPACPHTLIVDMGSTYRVTAFTYLARQDGTQNGMVKAYEVYLSTDGETWGSPVATGEFKNTTALQTATLKTPTAGRYLKFVANSEINGNAWSSAAEIGIEASADITGITPIHADAPVATVVYDLQGRRMTHSPLKKGVYIENGRKHMK